jgi:hypothetical protein
VQDSRDKQQQRQQQGNEEERNLEVDWRNPKNKEQRTVPIVLNKSEFPLIYSGYFFAQVGFSVHAVSFYS